MSDTVEILIPKNAFTIRYADGKDSSTAPETEDEVAPSPAKTTTDIPWPFARCVQYIVDNSQRFNATGPGIRQGGRILTAILGVPEEEKSKPLSKEDAKALSEEMEAPGPKGYIPPLHSQVGGKLVEQTVPARTFLSYLDAVADALK